MRDIFFEIESNLLERSERAEEQAKHIIRGEIETDIDLINKIKWVISQHYKIPFFDNYFDSRTLDELMMEYHMISLSKQTKEQVEKEYLESEEGQKAVSDEFADWEEEEYQNQLNAQQNQSSQSSGGWNEVAPPEQDVVQSDLDAATQAFMDSGKFPGEE